MAPSTPLVRSPNPRGLRRRARRLRMRGNACSSFAHLGRGPSLRHLWPWGLPLTIMPSHAAYSCIYVRRARDADFAEYLSDLSLTQTDNLCILSVTALLVYDWAVTLGAEQDLVWARKMNVASVLYVLARVSGPLYYVSTIVLLGFVSDTTCAALVYVQDVSALVPYVVWAVFSTYRGYALSGRNKYVAGVILSLTLIPIGVNVYNFVFTQPVNYPPPMGCITNIAISDSTLTMLSYLSRCSVILSEGIIVAWTWKCTGMQWAREYKTGLTGGATFAQSDKSFREVLFENGSLFFLVLFLFNIACLVLTQVGPLAIRGAISYFRDALTPLLVARFLLNLLALRRPADESSDTTDIFSTDVTGGLYESTASDVVDSYSFSVHEPEEGEAVPGGAARRFSDSLQFA